MGVEMRVHIFFPLLVFVLFAISGADGWPRGLALFFLLVAAVAVRETARLLVAAWLGLRLRAILLLPIGGLFAYANPESQENANRGGGQFVLAWPARWQTGARRSPLPAPSSAPAAMCGSSTIRSSLLPICFAAWSGCRLFWDCCTCCPLIRSIAAGLSATALPARTDLVPRAAPPPGWARRWPWPPCWAACWRRSHGSILAGFFIMIGAQIEDQGVFFQSVVDTVRMREVMLTDFATLSPSDTLADALYRCVHSLQEDFPVVRGPQLVGIVSRQRIVDALRNEGNGYVQSVMSRAFQVARPEDTLGTTIRRLTAGHGLPMIPVTESGRVVGIVSVQNLMSSMSLLAEQRRIERQESEN